MNRQICDLIQRRRLQLLIHSRIYYVLNDNIIADRQWDEWARELVELQQRYSEESKNTIWYEAFKDWDASTGAFLPLDDPWVIRKANQVLTWQVLTCENKSVPEQVEQKPKVKGKAKKLKKLF
jgi:hypothetical protein